LKLVKQVQLFVQEGSSDKVYEIDLCESGDGYVVNFRYGRRGAALKEGTKTIFPVPLQEAEKIFQSLEQEKRKKGYQSTGEAAIDTSFTPQPKATGEKRHKVIVKILKVAAQGEEPENWPISRVIWRAGDLKLTDALDSIIKLADPSDPFNIYSVVRTIGKCGSAKELPFLKNLISEKLDDHTKLLTKEVILQFLEPKEREELIQAIIETLPAPVKQSFKENRIKELNDQVRDLLFNLKTSENSYLVSLYQIMRHDPLSHLAFNNIIRDVPLDVNYFKHIRHILKTAEMLDDYSVYAIIAQNIEKQSYRYTSGWMSPEYKKQRAFSDKTKQYFIRRFERNLKKLGEAGEPGYIAMATEILLSFNDERDLTQPHSNTFTTYNYNSQTRRYTPETHVKHYDSYSKNNAFNYILYKKSTRYEKGKTEWKCVAPYTPGNPAPKAREEAFPKLWDQAPKEIIRLLAFSKCFKVHEFAHKVFRANADFEAQVERGDIICFFEAPFTITQNLGLEIARKIFNKQDPDKQLLTAMLDCKLEEARKQAQQWVQELKSSLLSDAEFVAGLMIMKLTEAHAWLRGLFTTSTFSKELSDVVTVKTIAHLISLNVETEGDEKYALQVGDSLIIGFSETLSKVSLAIVKDLFQHKSPVIHAIAGKILLKHEVRPENLPEDFLRMLLQSENINSRGIGIELLGKFPEQKLLEKKEILVSFCLSPMADVRNSVKPIISKLTAAFPAFGEELVQLFVPALMMKETYEGVHDDLLALLTTELSNNLHIIDREMIFGLLTSKFRKAQLMGAALLKKNVAEESLAITELVKLASNPLEDVRILSRNILEKYPEKAKDQKEEALKITDSLWNDTRSFAFAYFRKIFTPADWNINLLVSLCDSTKEDVQAFGREMIAVNSSAEDGTEYLIKLSQHPNTNLQLFTSLYLEKYASGKPEIIEKLKLYFITILSQVNKGRVAKARAMEFLKTQAMQNEPIAGIAAEILSRTSASVAITEKAACIDALRDIKKKYPAMSIPLVMKEYSDFKA
jgi:predicted DNA-binding WGR domain protein